MTSTPAPLIPPTTVAVVLAAGLSRRFGTTKQLLPWRGSTLVRHAVQTLLDAGNTTVVVVVGHDAAAVRAACGGLAISFIENPAFAAGQGTSVAAAAAWAHAQHAHTLVFVPCDQPFISPEHIRTLVAAPPAPVWMLRVAGQPTQPSRWDAATFPLLAQLNGDSGGRSLIQRGLVQAQFLDCDDPLLLRDIDTPEEYAALCAL